jgi:hypothetical protein
LLYLLLTLLQFLQELLRRLDVLLSVLRLIVGRGLVIPLVLVGLFIGLSIIGGIRSVVGCVVLLRVLTFDYDCVSAWSGLRRRGHRCSRTRRERLVVSGRLFSRGRRIALRRTA